MLCWVPGWTNLMIFGVVFIFEGIFFFLAHINFWTYLHFSDYFYDLGHLHFWDLLHFKVTVWLRVRYYCLTVCDVLLSDCMLCIIAWLLCITIWQYVTCYFILCITVRLYVTYYCLTACYVLLSDCMLCITVWQYVL